MDSFAILADTSLLSLAHSGHSAKAANGPSILAFQP